MILPKYARLEIERRWLIAPGTPLDLSAWPERLIEDWYLDGGHLRLRRESLGGAPPSIWKLCKKYGRPEGFSQPMVNIYLSAEEWSQLRALPGRLLVKRRYTVATTDLAVVDVFEGTLLGLRSFEFEAESLETVTAYKPPPWVGPEITANPRFAGGALASTTTEAIQAIVQEALLTAQLLEIATPTRTRAPNFSDEGNGASDGTRTRDLRRDRPAL